MAMVAPLLPPGTVSCVSQTKVTGTHSPTSTPSASAGHLPPVVTGWAETTLEDTEPGGSLIPISRSQTSRLSNLSERLSKKEALSSALRRQDIISHAFRGTEEDLLVRNVQGKARRLHLSSSSALSQLRTNALEALQFTRREEMLRAHSLLPQAIRETLVSWSPPSSPPSTHRRVWDHKFLDMREREAPEERITSTRQKTQEVNKDKGQGGISRTIPCMVQACYRYAVFGDLCAEHAPSWTTGAQLTLPCSQSCPGSTSNTSPYWMEVIPNPLKELSNGQIAPLITETSAHVAGLSTCKPIVIEQVTEATLKERAEQRHVLFSKAAGVRGRGPPLMMMPTSPVFDTADGSAYLQAPRKNCRIAGCKSLVKTKGLCKRHGGGIRCQHESCHKSAKRGGFCIRHGGGICQVAGCKAGERKNRMCAFHNAREIAGEHILPSPSSPSPHESNPTHQSRP